MDERKIRSSDMQPAPPEEFEELLDGFAKVISKDPEKAAAALRQLQVQDQPKESGPAMVYDAVIHGEEQRLGRLMIFLVNHLFKTKYSGDEEFRLGQTELYETKNGEMRTIRADSYFTIVAGDGSKCTFHIECQARRDGSIVLRVVEYDMMYALANAKERSDGWELPFPESAVIFLESPGKKLSEKMRYRLVRSDGSMIWEQEIKTVTVARLSIAKMFDESLYALLPFWLFSHGGSLKRLESSEEGQHELLDEARNLTERILNEKALTASEQVQLLEFATEVMRHKIKDKALSQELEEIMYYKPIELRTDKLIQEQLAKGEERGFDRGFGMGIDKGIDMGIDKGIDKTMQNIVRSMRSQSISDSKILQILRGAGATDLEAKKYLEAAQ